VLITKRPEGKHLAGFWEFPGGKQERGETLETCLEREMKEELSIEVRVGKHLYTVHHEYEDRKVSLHLFSCTHLEGDLKPLDSQEIKWVSHEDLSQYRFPSPDLELLRWLRDFI
jgi:mutator protein MutT